MPVPRSKKNQEQVKRRRGRPSKYDTPPIPIPTTPEKLAAAVLRTKPSELEEWRRSKSR